MLETIDPVLDTAEIQAATKQSKSKVCQELRQGNIRGFRLGTKWVARQSEVYAYLKRIEEDQLASTAA
jgi:hypothetical protein